MSATKPMLVASGTVGLLVVGLLGMTYSLLSASWDDEKQTSEGIGGVKTFNTSSLNTPQKQTLV